MHGIPRILQTRADFDLALAMARSGEAHPPIVAAHFAGLIEASRTYVFDKVLAEGEAPDGSMPAYCVLEGSEALPTRAQLKQVTDPVARLFALGYTVAEVETIITELGAL
jgi:hypothetical protein